MGIQEILEKNRLEILMIADKHRVEDIKVFGSVARGEAQENSVVDFLITTGSKVSPWFPGGLIADLEELLGRKVDVVETEALRPEIRPKILCEARSFRRLRNLLVHDYLGINLDRIWEIIHEDLPPLIEKIKALKV